MGLSCQKIQVMRWGNGGGGGGTPLLQRTNNPRHLKAGCRCTVTVRGTRGQGRSPQRSLGQSPSSSPWVLLSGYTEKKSCLRALGGETSSFVVPPFLSYNLWPQVSSLTCLQEDGQGIPSPNSHLLDIWLISSPTII